MIEANADLAIGHGQVGHSQNRHSNQHINASHDPSHLSGHQFTGPSTTYTAQPVITESRWNEHYGPYYEQTDSYYRNLHYSSQMTNPGSASHFHSPAYWLQAAVTAEQKALEGANLTNTSWSPRSSANFVPTQPSSLSSSSSSSSSSYYSNLLPSLNSSSSASSASSSPTATSPLSTQGPIHPLSLKSPFPSHPSNAEPGCTAPYLSSSTPSSSHIDPRMSHLVTAYHNYTNSFSGLGYPHQANSSYIYSSPKELSPTNFSNKSKQSEANNSSIIEPNNVKKESDAGLAKYEPDSGRPSGEETLEKTEELTSDESNFEDEERDEEVSGDEEMDESENSHYAQRDFESWPRVTGHGSTGFSSADHEKQGQDYKWSPNSKMAANKKKPQPGKFHFISSLFKATLYLYPN